MVGGVGANGWLGGGGGMYSSGWIGMGGARVERGVAPKGTKHPKDGLEFRSKGLEGAGSRYLERELRYSVNAIAF